MKKVIVYNKQNGERFEYSLPFNYIGITYAIDINGNIIAIEQIYVSGEWQYEEVYQLHRDQQLFEITITEE